MAKKTTTITSARRSKTQVKAATEVKASSLKSMPSTLDTMDSATKLKGSRAGPAKRFGDIERRGVRAYRQELTDIIRQKRPVVIERHGQPVGLYLPLKPRDREREAQLATTLTRSLDDLQAQSGLDEEALAQFIEGALKVH